MILFLWRYLKAEVFKHHPTYQLQLKNVILEKILVDMFKRVGGNKRVEGNKLKTPITNLSLNQVFAPHPIVFILLWHFDTMLKNADKSTVIWADKWSQRHFKCIFAHKIQLQADFDIAEIITHLVLLSTAPFNGRHSGSSISFSLCPQHPPKCMHRKL